MKNFCTLIGTHGVGKTTTFEYLQNIINDNRIKFIPDLARKCPYKVGIETTAKAQLWIIREQIRLQILTDIAICDKSIIDHYAYIVYWYGRRNNIEKRLQKNIKNYKLIIKFPINSKFLIDDGLRPTSKKLQITINNIINELISEWKLDVINIPKNERYINDWVYKIIRNWINGIP